LTKLELSFNDSLSEAGLIEFFSKADLSSVENLCFRKCHNLTDNVMIQANPKFSKLDVSFCTGIGNKFLNYLANSQNSQCLEKLKLSGCEQIPDSGLSYLTSLQSH